MGTLGTCPVCPLVKTALPPARLGKPKCDPGCDSSHGGIRAPNPVGLRGSLGPGVHTPDSISIGSVVLASLTLLTNRARHRPTDIMHSDGGLIISTSRCSNGSDSPHRRGVTPCCVLLVASGGCEDYLTLPLSIVQGSGT